MSKACKGFCPDCPVKLLRAVPSCGPADADVMLVGEAPGHSEVVEGRPFVGRSGNLLNIILQRAGFDREDLYIANSANCYPKVDLEKHADLGNDFESIITKLKTKCMHACQNRLYDEICAVRPKVVIGFGAMAMRSILQIPEGILKIRGSVHRVTIRDHTFWFVPTLHPAYLLRGQEHATHVAIADVAKAKALLDGVRPREERLIVVERGRRDMFDAACNTLREWIDRKATVAIDVETTGISPIEDKLKSIAIAATDDNIAVVFPTLINALDPFERAELLNLTKQICADIGVTKVFQNLGFDCTAMEMAGMPVKGSIYDTLVLHHVAEPELPHGLDWIAQTYLMVSPWKSEERRNEKRGIATLRSLMVYNARDALYTAWLLEPLQEAVREVVGVKVAEKETECAQLARKMSITGIPIKQATLNKLEVDLLSRRDTLMSEMRRDMKWPELDLNKPSHRAEYLYERLSLPVRKYTEKTMKPSTSYKAVVDFMHVPEVAKYVEWTDVAHQLSTFVKGTRKRVSNDWRLRPSWNLFGTCTSRWTSQPNCFDGETEILTEHGWIRFDKLKKNVKVAQYEDGHVNLVYPTRYIRRKYTGRMIRLESRFVDLYTTDDHRILLKAGRNEENVVLTAGELYERVPSRARLIQGADSHAHRDIAPSKELVQLLCACQADGWRRFYNPVEAWEFRFTKKRKIKRLRNTLKVLGDFASWHESTITRPDRRETVFYLKPSPAKDFVDQYIERNKEKTFNRDILAFAPDALSTFVEEVHNWDGRYARKNEYASTNKSNADLVQIADFLTGRCGNVREFWGNRSKKPCYVVQRGRKNGLSGIDKKHVTANTVINKDVYCLSVPSSFIVVRRNGKVVVTGQCQNWPKDLRVMVEPQDGRILVGADYAALEFRILACFSGCIGLLKAIEDGVDIHSLNASRILGEAWNKLDDNAKLTMRTLIKRVVYGLNYGAQPDKLTAVLREDRKTSVELRSLITQPRVQEIRRGFFRIYPEIEQYQQDQVEFANTNGYIEVPPLLRRRYFGAIPVQPTKAFNFRIQCAAGDIMNLALLNLDATLPDSADILINGHDAVVVECYEHQAERVAKLIEDAMFYRLEENGFGVDLVAKADIGRTWNCV